MKSGALLRSARYEGPSSSSSRARASSSEVTQRASYCGDYWTYRLGGPLHPTRRERHKIYRETPGSRWPVLINLPSRSECSTRTFVKLNSAGFGARTSILSMSIFPYCLFISLLASCIASTVAIVFRRLSVARAADSMLNVCWTSCASWDSYIRFCFSVRIARCCTAFCATRRVSQMMEWGKQRRKQPFRVHCEV